MDFKLCYFRLRVVFKKPLQAVDFFCCLLVTFNEELIVLFKLCKGFLFCGLGCFISCFLFVLFNADLNFLSLFFFFFECGICLFQLCL